MKEQLRNVLTLLCQVCAFLPCTGAGELSWTLPGGDQSLSMAGVWTMEKSILNHCFRGEIDYEEPLVHLGSD